jgi:hypothetical protein
VPAKEWPLANEELLAPPKWFEPSVVLPKCEPEKLAFERIPLDEEEPREEFPKWV